MKEDIDEKVFNISGSPAHSFFGYFRVFHQNNNHHYLSTTHHYATTTDDNLYNYL
jgi:hypothetical protein